MMSDGGIYDTQIGYFSIYSHMSMTVQKVGRLKNNNVILNFLFSKHLEAREV